MLADGAEDAELDAEPPVMRQVGVEELVHFAHDPSPCCSEGAHQREWRLHADHAGKVSGLPVKDAVLPIKRCAVREQEARDGNSCSRTGKSRVCAVLSQSMVERRHKCSIHSAAIKRS